jgi:isopenicillin-N epimerase
MGARMKAEQFALLPQQTFLNAGSYGATPRVVLDARLEWEACEMVGPWAWRVSTLPLRLRQVQNRLAEFVGAHPADLQLMVNANAGTSTILKSLPWEAGDVLLLFSCDYDATKLAARWLEATYGVQTEYIDATLPMTDDAIVRALTTFLQVRRTQKQPMPRLFNFCHCTSRTGWIFPAKRLTDAAHEFGVTVMIDGAQVPGHFPLDISHIAPEYYVGTCHKWMMTPPGVGFVVVAPSKQRVVRPLAAATPHEDAFARAFAASAPQDATPFLAVLQAFEFVDRVCGGWRSVWEYNATLARQAVRELTRMWNLEAERLECLQSAQVFHNGRPGVDAVNCLPVVPLPRGRGATAGDATRLMGYLLTRKETTAFLIVERIRCPDGTVCPVLCVRLTCQVHVSLDDVRRLGRAVAELQGTYKVGVDGAPDGEGDPVSMDYDANSFHVA